MSETKRKGELHRFGEQGAQITLPCRYCGAPHEMSRELVENLHSLMAAKRNEPPLRKDEIAVCVNCRSRWERELYPPRFKPLPQATASDDDDENSPDGFGPPEDHQATLAF